jgi:hypothetical protein
VNRIAATKADTELTLAKQKPTLKLKKDDGTFNGPFDLVECNEQKCKLLSLLAARLSCIPATSALQTVFFSGWSYNCQR